jgi:Protein of unknown function (DUF992)
VHFPSYEAAALTVLIFAHGVVPASAQQARTEVGLLTCGITRSEQTQSGAEVVVSLRQTWALECAFRPANGDPEETYTGTLQSVGAPKELSEKRPLIWIVKGARGRKDSPGLLQQVYAADVAANPGQSPPLTGEADTSLVLETLADEHVATPSHSKRPITSAMIVLVNLILKSAPA